MSASLSSIIAFFVLVSGTNSCFSQVYYHNYQTILGDSLVKEGFIEVETVRASKGKGKTKNTIILVKKYSNYRLVERKSISNGKISKFNSYSYDITGKLVSEKEYSSKGNLLFEISHTYKGNVIESSEYLDYNGYKLKVVFHFDSLGQLIHEDLYKYGHLFSIRSYEYLNEGTQKKIYTFFRDTTSGFDNIDTLGFTIQSKDRRIEIHYSSIDKTSQNNIYFSKRDSNSNLEFSMETYTNKKEEFCLSRYNFFNGALTEGCIVQTISISSSEPDIGRKEVFRYVRNSKWD